MTNIENIRQKAPYWCHFQDKMEFSPNIGNMYIAWVQVYCSENKPAREFGPLTRALARALGPNYYGVVLRAISLIPCDISYIYR